MKYLTILAVLLSLYLFSCNKDDLNKPSSSQIHFEGEGGQKEIILSDGDWEIAKIVNQNNNRKIFGDIYSIDGNLIQKNHLLKLDSSGRLETFWSNKGFSIERKDPTTMELNLKENLTKKGFIFIIYLQSGEKSKKITVNQNPSLGYTVKNIEYTLAENDSDSIYIQQGETYSFNINTSSTQQSVAIAPFANTNELSHFESDEYAAFPWKSSDSMMVEVPTAISDHKIFTNGEKSPYSKDLIGQNSKFKDLKTEKISIPPGHSAFVVNMEYRKRSVTYLLHLTNNRTQKEKVIKGKWVEFAPTGNYTIDWK